MKKMKYLAQCRAYEAAAKLKNKKEKVFIINQKKINVKT